MASQQLFLVADSSTLANFKSWAQAISAWFGTCGWVQTADTGQVNWSSIASVPGSGAYIYEIWKPGDALTVFYVKVEYGNTSGTNCPSLRFTLSTATNGAGTPSGFVAGPIKTNTLAFTPPSSVTTYECDFSGANNRIAVMLWRNCPSGNIAHQLFAIERSLDNTGAYTGDYATLWTVGLNNNSCNSQQSLVFAVGPAPAMLSGGPYVNWGVKLPGVGAGATSAFNNAIPFDTCAPLVGPWGQQATSVGVVQKTDIAEGVTFAVTLYGATRTYMPSFAAQPFDNFGLTQINANHTAVCMRYD